MEQTLSERIGRVLAQTSGLYYRLVLVVGAPRSGKSWALSEVGESHGWQVFNVNLELCERLLELSRKQRALRVPRILADMVDALDRDVVLLDNIEVLFDPQLAQDPLRLLQGLARNRTVVAAWPGGYDGDVLTYAEPGHPEWRRYRSPEAMVVTVDSPPIVEGLLPAPTRSGPPRSSTTGSSLPSGPGCAPATSRCTTFPTCPSR